MLTLITPLKVIKVRHSKAVKIDPATWLGVSTSSHGYAIELEAAIKGEAYTMGVFDHSADEESRFTFVCSDGPVTLQYRKETLARHSLLINYFIETFPEATEMELRDHSRRDVIEWAKSIFSEFPRRLGSRPLTLTSSMISLVQLLTPPTSLYFFLFDLPVALDPSFVLTTLREITEEERHQILEAYYLRSEHMHEENDERSLERPLPQAGRGLAIAYALEEVAGYLRYRYVPELHDRFPSYTFYEMVNRGCSETFDGVKPGSFLLEKDFEDESGTLARKDDRSFLISEILSHCHLYDWEQCLIIFAMLGLKHAGLGNEEVDKVAPYQVVLEPGILRRDDWIRTRRRLSEIPKAPIELIDSLMEPFIKYK